MVKFCYELLDYVLFFGFFGLGKIILFNIIVNEMEVNICIVLGFLLERFGDLVVILLGF